MKARRRGTLVHTEQGPGAIPKPQPISVESVPVDVTGAEISVLQPRTASTPKPERVCPHGGIYLGTIAVCGECGQADVEELFGLAVINLCARVARKHYVPFSSQDDNFMVAAAALVEPKNRKKIISANTPDAMAYRIAEYAILKTFRRTRSVRLSTVGGMNFDDDLSTSKRLEVISKNEVLRQEADEWSQACYERVRTIPGIGVLWTDANFTRLQVAIDEAKKELATRPFSVWMVIAMKLGIGEGMDEYEWSEIAEHFADSGVSLNVRQCKYAYDKGLESMKNHILNSMMPLKKLSAQDSTI
jgi:hypothetical protein